MARKNIQGITIEIGGDTTKLQSALKGVESKLKNTQAALKDVNKLLKLDPGNVELLTQKQKLLTDAIGDTKSKLDTLKDAQEQMKAAGQTNTAEYDALQREIIETEQQLKGLTAEMKNFGSVAAQQVAAAGQKVKELGDKVQKVGTGMTKYVTGPIVAVGAASVAAFNEVDEGLDIIVKKTGATGDALEDMQKRAENLATSIPTDFATAGSAIGEVNTRFGLTGDALEDLSGKFIKFAQLNDTDVSSAIDTAQSAMSAYGIEAKYAGNILDMLNKAVQDTGTDVGTLTSALTSNAAALQEMGFNFNASVGFISKLSKSGLDSGTVMTGLSKVLKNATKEGKTMDKAMAELQNSLKNAKSETAAMQIATEMFGAKAAPSIVKAVRDGRLSFDMLSNSVADFGGSVDQTFENTLDPIDEFKTALNELKIVGMELVSAAAPMIKQLADAVKGAISGIRSWWEGLSPIAQQTIVKAAAIAAAIGPVLIVVGKLTSAIGSIMSLAPTIVSIIGTVKTALSGLWAVLAANPIALVVAAIAALVAGFIYLWNKCDAFREFWINLWDNIKTIASNVWKGITDGLKKAWDNIKNTAKNVWSGIGDTIKGFIDKIKNFFSFKWELPKIPLPHFKIEGSFSIAPPRVPHLSIDWYKKAMNDGMILTSPTIFGASNGKLLGGGEAGAEAVVGVDSLRSMIASAVSGSSTAARNVTVVLQLDRTELGRTVFQLNNYENQRMGVRLATN